MHFKFIKYSFFVKVIFLLILHSSCSNNTKKIPIISNDIAMHQNEIDTMHFVNHLNKRVLISNLKGNVHIVNFFFTSCTTICPLMEEPLNKLAKKHRGVKFLSFTIDPDHDDLNVLKNYHKMNKQNNQILLRGTKENLKTISKLYLSTIDSFNNENLYHTTNVVLIDKKLNIRGIYDCLDPDDLAFLEEDINILNEN